MIWKNRSFVILLSGQWVSQVGNALFIMAVSWYVLTRTHNRTLLGYVMAVEGLAGIAAMISGVYADRWNRKGTLVVTDIIRAILAAALALWLVSGHLTIWELALGLLVLNLLATLFQAAQGGYLPEVTGPEAYTEAGGVTQSTGAAAQLAGLGIGGFLLALGGPLLLFIINAATFAVSAGSLTLTRSLKAPEKPGAEPSPSSVWGDLRVGLKMVWQSPFLKRLVPVAVLINFVITPVGVMDVAWVREVLHRGAVSYGFFTTSILAGMVLGGLFMAQIRKWSSFSIVSGWSLAVSGLALAGMTMVLNYAANLVFLFVMGIAIGVVSGLVNTRVILDTPPAFRGRISGALNALVTALIPVGLALSGWASGPLGLPWLFRLSGMALAVLALGFIGMPEAQPAVDSSPAAGNLS